MQKLTDLMSRDVKVVSPDMSIQEAANEMRQGDFGMLPVGENDRMIGAVTDRDIATRIVACGKDPAAACACDAMSSPVKTVVTGSSLRDATCMMEAEKIRRLIVVDGEGKLAGVAAIADLSLAGKDEATASVVKEVSEPGKA